MKNTIDKMSLLLKHHNISLHKGTQKTHSRDNTEYHGRFHALKAEFSKYYAFLIDSGTSNHMVASKESFSSLNISNDPSIHMGDDTQIQAEGKGSIKLEHGVFKDVVYVPSLEKKLLSVYQMNHTSSPK